MDIDVDAARVRVLATDYDRTLTDEALEPVIEVRPALLRAKRAGLRVIIVSGRDLPFLQQHVGDVADAIVAENGCLVAVPGRGIVRAGDPSWDLRTILPRSGVACEYGDVIASFDRANEAAIREVLADAHVACDLIPNLDRIMVLPKGVDKASGLTRALDGLGARVHEAAVAGDGENDLAMFRLAPYGIAVRNAVPVLKTRARYVTSEPGGHGVVEWLDAVWGPARRATGSISRVRTLDVPG